MFSYDFVIGVNIKHVFRIVLTVLIISEEIMVIAENRIF